MKQQGLSAAACLLRRTAVAALALAGVAAQAVVSAPDTDLGNGDFNYIHYGAAQDGAVFQINALFYAGDGLETQQIKQRVFTLPDFKFDANGVGPTGAGTALSEYDYRITNVGAVAHNDLHFMAVLGVDGNPDTLKESVAETWGAEQAGDPVKREVSDWDGTVEHALNSLVVTRAAAGLIDGGVPAACQAPSVCDTFVALQWNVATLNPGDSFLVRLGLSDNGQHLSSRYLTISADPTNGINNALTVSGTVAVTPAVPEPGSVALLLAGLGVIGGLVWHRRAG